MVFNEKYSSGWIPKLQDNGNISCVEDFCPNLMKETLPHGNWTCSLPVQVLTHCNLTNSQVRPVQLII